MRGLYSSKTEIRRKIFKEVAKMAYEGGDFTRVEQLPYKIIPGEMASFRESIFLERAIVGERLRLAMGMSLRSVSEHAELSQGLSESVVAEKYYEPPLINIIKFACHSCPEKRVFVTNGCQGCFEHPCKEVCPTGAISMVKGKSVIDEEKCVKCGKCVDVCPYNAIIKQERPCAVACGMNAIKNDEHGRADIDQDKCVSCGMCLVSCPFAAISDKSQIFQTILALKSDAPVYAALAPAFAGQFGDKLPQEKLQAAFKELGFEDVVEVAIGADLCTISEARDFLEEVPEKQPFMATSCCPAWSVMAKKLFPDFAPYISMALTPMVLTARLIKNEHPNAKVVFIGPCAAKKLEASRRTVRSDVDFVLTFEEVMQMFEAENVDFEAITDSQNSSLQSSSSDGRGFAISGGVANAVVNQIKKIDPNREVKVISAEGLHNCRKMLMVAKTGKYNGYLLEGMACPGGCVAGAGTIQPIKKSVEAVKKTMNDADIHNSQDTSYKKYLEIIEERNEEQL
ncbi:MAG: 4Fe-4S dicluster domain-containing protein [Lachnotalea sp.]